MNIDQPVVNILLFFFEKSILKTYLFPTPNDQATGQYKTTEYASSNRSNSTLS
jgi:hypothetical protein